MQIGYSGEDRFCNARQEVVQWKFIGVPEIHHLANLCDGAELYSRITEADDAGTHVNAVALRAATISKNMSHQLLQTH